MKGATLKIKAGVVTTGLLIEITQTFPLIDQIFDRYNYTAELVQAVIDKDCYRPHHAVGLAVDIAFPPDNVGLIFGEIQFNLGNNFSVVRVNNYIHIAFIGTVTSTLKEIETTLKTSTIAT